MCEDEAGHQSPVNNGRTLSKDGLIQGRMSLKPKRCVSVIRIGDERHVDHLGLGLSLKRIGPFENWSTSADEKGLLTFLHEQPYVMKFIPGRADWDRILRTAAKTEVQELRQGKKRRITRHTAFE
jgi:hypothetical protein